MRIPNMLKFSLVLIIFIICSNVGYAITQDEAGQIIAQFAINFYDNYANETIYSLTNYADNVNSHRAYAYRGQKISGNAELWGDKGYANFTDKYAMDCVGFVSFCIHHSLHIGDSNVFTCFVTPQSGARNGFVQVTDGTRKPGDILANSGHVAVYIGNGVIIDSAAGGPNYSITKKATASKYPKTFRISQETAANINQENTTVQFNGVGSTDYNFDYLGGAGSYTSLTEILSGTAPDHWTENCKDFSGTLNWTNVTYIASTTDANVDSNTDSNIDSNTDSNISGDGSYVAGSMEEFSDNYGAIVLSAGESERVLQDLFEGEIPTTQAEMTKWLVTIQVPYLDKEGNRKTRNLQVHKKLAENFIQALTEIADIGFKAYDLGTYSFRNATAANILSQHAYGVAIDVNPAENPYIGETGNSWERESEYAITNDVVSIMKRHGFRWGGEYEDFMHFSISGR